MKFHSRARPVLHARSHAAAGQAGFTVIELMVTVALAAILAAVAVPGIKTMVTNSKVTSLGNEFVMGAAHARAEAIARNRCVTMCLSDDLSVDTPVCGDGTDWKAGWIIFANPKCDNASTDASAELLKIYMGASDGPTLIGGTTLKALRFDSRGMTSLSAAQTMSLTPPGETATKMVCVDIAGRTRIVNTTSTICNDSSN